MPHVAALYRYPVKGFTPESCESLTVLPSGRVAGDRVLGVRFADSPTPADDWSSKREMLVLMNTPELARLNVQLDQERGVLRIGLNGDTLVESPLDREGRERLAGALASFALSVEESPLRNQPSRLPLRIVGDGHEPRYHDNPDGQVSLHGLASVRALGEALDDPELSELRFRSNISVEGLPAWEELSWVGQEILVGEMRFSVVKEKVRCLATHANPVTGLRDRSVMNVLTDAFGHAQPMMGVALAAHSGGVIRLGDVVRLAES